MKKLLYISHPYGAKRENLIDISNIVSKLYSDDDIYKKYCIVSPVHAFGFMYEEYDKVPNGYEKGLTFCTDLLEHCDLMIVFGDYSSSKGCKAEIELCDKLGIKYIKTPYLDDDTIKWLKEF